MPFGRLKDNLSLGLLMVIGWCANIGVARNNFKQNLSNKLADKLLNGDSRSFWSIWNAEFGNPKSVHTSIGEKCKASKVAQSFAHSFSNNFYDSAFNDKLNVFWVHMSSMQTTFLM